MTDFEDRYERPALVIVDMQNDFVRQGAPLEVADARASIEAHRALISLFRSRRAPIVYTKFLSAREPNLLWNWSPECQPETKCCWQGHRRGYGDTTGELDCTDIIEEIYPAPEDIIIEKYGYGAFHATGLDEVLRTLGVRSLIVTGTVTQICVEETARSLSSWLQDNARRGCRVVVRS